MALMVCSASVLAGAIRINQALDAGSRLRIASRSCNAAVLCCYTLRTLHATIAKRSSRSRRAIHRYSRRGAADARLRRNVAHGRVVSAGTSTSHAIGVGCARCRAIVRGRFAHLARGTVTADGALVALAKCTDRVAVGAIRISHTLHATKTAATPQSAAITREAAVGNRA
jgi:hypothetical protein